MNGVNKLNDIDELNGNSKESKTNLNQDGSYASYLNKPPNVNLIGPLIKTFWKEFIIVALFRLFALCIQFINPLILDSLLTYIKNPDAVKWEGFVYALGMFCVMLL